MTRAPAPRAEAQAEIAAPIDAVFSLMTDWVGYPAWNPFVARVEPLTPTLALGQRLRLHVRWAEGGAVESVERVTRLEPPGPPDAEGARHAALEYEFLGPLHALGLVRGRRLQTLEQRGDGPTVYRSIEVFGGLLARFVPLARVQDGFERHAAALRAHATRAEPTRPKAASAPPTGESA